MLAPSGSSGALSEMAGSPPRAPPALAARSSSLSALPDTGANRAAQLLGEAVSPPPGPPGRAKESPSPDSLHHSPDDGDDGYVQGDSSDEEEEEEASDEEQPAACEADAPREREPRPSAGMGAGGAARSLLNALPSILAMSKPELTSEQAAEAAARLSVRRPPALPLLVPTLPAHPASSPGGGRQVARLLRPAQHGGARRAALEWLAAAASPRHL